MPLYEGQNIPNTPDRNAYPAVGANCIRPKRGVKVDSGDTPCKGSPKRSVPKKNKENFQIKPQPLPKESKTNGHL